jgi:xylulose-5-phosphate/fructose-6-phosphate phosphoketolase
MATVLSEKESALIDAYWRAANYLSVGQIYLFDNPLLKVPLSENHVKPRLLGHDAGPQLHLCPPQPADQETRP